MTFEGDFLRVLGGGTATNSTAGAVTPENTLTVEKLRDVMRQFPAPPADDLFNPFRLPTFAGCRIYEAPPPPPRLQVRDIKLRDGTSLLPAHYRAQVNAELLERFGFSDDPFKDKIYMLGSYAMVMKPEYSAILRNLGP